MIQSSVQQRHKGAELGEAALDYAKGGWPVLPIWWPKEDGRCACGKPDCNSPAKHPIGGLVPRGLRDATLDPAVIGQWWLQYPSANVAIATGSKSGIVVEDLDGEAECLKSEREKRGIPSNATPTVLTGSGGQHSYFRHPGEKVPTKAAIITLPAVNGGKRSQVDIRGDGGYVLAPPSLHVSGQRYTWLPGRDPLSVELAPFPPALLDLVRQPRVQSQSEVPLSGPDGEAHVHKLLRRLEVVRPSAGGWTARCPAHQDRHPSLSIKAGHDRRILLHCFGGCPPEAVVDALGLTMADLFASGERNGASGDSGGTADFAPRADGGQVPIKHLTDLGNSKRLVSRHGGDLRFCHPQRTWFVWDGTRWKRDVTGEVTRRAKETVLSIYEEAAAEQDEERRKALAKHAPRCESEGKIKAMVSLSASEPGVSILPEQMDHDVWVFNVLNGTIDLRTGKLRPHRREDFLTKLAPVTFDPGATCPTWEAFLYRIMDGSKDLVGFLQRAVGYSLTGDVSEQLLLFLHGFGANGKTTLLNLILTLVGEYGRQAVPELLLVKRGESHPTERADLAGRRFIACTEVEEGRRMAEVMVKQLTGGDRQTARKMREDFFEFSPTAKIWLGGNHRPTIRGTDYAIWRRIALVPFTVTISPEEQDRHLLDKLRAELSGILTWAVKGCLEWQETGLRPPDEVRAATQEYRAEQDVLAEFFADRCITGADKAESARGLFRAYEGWCEHSGEKPVGSRAFGMALRERGLRDERRRNGKWWIGIGLAEPTTA